MRLHSFDTISQNFHFLDRWNRQRIDINILRGQSRREYKAPSPAVEALIHYILRFIYDERKTP